MRVRFTVAVLACLMSAAQSYAACSDVPKITVSFSENAEGGLVAKIVEENAPYIYITYRGPTVDRLSGEDDTVYFGLGRSCMSGPEQFKVEGKNLYSDCEPAVFTSMIAPLDTTPQLTPVAGAGVDAAAKVVFPNSGGNGGIGWLKITYVDGENNPPKVKRDEQASDATYGISDEKGGAAIFEATSCGDKLTELVVPFQGKKECDEDCQNGGCDECVGKPVSVISGNMRATDDDPLAGFGDVIPLRRTYDSLATLDGVFGARWSSLFDASLRVHPALAGGDWVTVIGEDGKQFVFRTTGSGYRQVVPAGLRRQTVLERYADGSWGHVDRDRNLVRIFDSNGIAVAYRNSDTGREVRITWTAGVPTRIEDSWQAWAYTITTHPTTGYIASIVRDGHPEDAWTYTYTAERLITVQSPIGTWRSYSYPWNGQRNRYERLSVVKNGAGHILESHSYDAYQRAVTSLQDADDITAISDAQAGRVAGEKKVIVTYKTGRQETYYRRYVAGQWRVVEISGGCASCAGSSVVTFDAKGNIVRAQGSDGYITTNQYDEAGRNVVRRITGLRPVNCDPATAADRCRLTPEFLEAASAFGNSSASTITEYVYGDPNWSERPTLITTLSVVGAAERRTEALTYDAATGEVLTRTVSGWTGEPRRLEVRTNTTVLHDGIAAAEFAPGGSFDAAWLSLPQPQGTRRTIDGPLSGTSDSTAFVYYPIDATVPAQLRGRLAATRNAAGHIVRFEDYDLHGNARRVIDPNGVAENRTYDALGRLTASTLEGGGAGCSATVDPLCAVAITNTRSYDGAGPLKMETKAGGGVTLYEYDDRARVSAVSRGTSATDLRERVETTYDPLTGRKSVEKMLAREGGTWVVKRQTSYRYDTSAQMDRVTNADQTTVDYGYDGAGHLRSVRDENHAAPNTFYDYDAAGRVTEVRQVLATAPGGFATTVYTYDLSGNLSSVTDPNLNVTTYVYDDFGQMLKQTSPVTGVTSHEYDAAGQLVRTTDANNAVTTRTYDVLGRILTTVAARGAVSERSTWTYDTAAHGIGRLSSVTDSTGTTTYSYERRGLLQREEKTIAGSTYVTAFQYDRDGNRSAITYPSGRVVTYTFDYAGRPYSATTGTMSLVTSAKYLPFGPQTELVLGNGTRRTTTYDQRYRPLTNALAGLGGPLAQYTYTHDAAGNVKSILDERDHGYDRTFEYDDLHRLVVANSGSALWGNGSYSYDAMGNMLASALGPQSQSFLYRGVTPLLDTVTTDGVTRSVTYDAAGNETSWTTGTGLYSARNMLQATDTFAYAYDARGVRTITEIATSVQLAGLTVSPAQFRGGDSVQATVTLTAPAPAGGAVVRLSGPARGVRIPAFVTVPAGATFTTFTVATDPVSADITETLVATRAATYRATITMRRSCALATLSVSSSTVTGGATLTATLTLHEPAGAGGAVVALTSSDPAVAPLPASVAVPAGQTTITINVNTAPVTTAVPVTFTAELCGTAVASFDVLPVRIETLTLSPAAVRSGSPAAATISISGPAPAGGMFISIASSDSAVAAVPATVTVPAGATSAAFQITTTRRDTEVPVVITATESGISVSAVLTVMKCTPAAVPPIPDPGELVWFDDALPTGAAPSGTWTWDTTQYASGTRSTVNAITSGYNERSFLGTSVTLTPADEDRLFMYVLIDPCNPPREIMLGWYDGAWSHDAYWGEDLIVQPGRVRIGDLPIAGQWARLEVPAPLVKVNNRTITGLAIYVYGGRAWFDRAGKVSCERPNVQPSTTFPAEEMVWFDDAPPAGAVLTGTWSWEGQVLVSGALSHSDPVSTTTAEHKFTSATPALVPASGDQLFTYAYIDPCNPPKQILLEWYDGTWNHRVYWGQAVVQRTGAVSMGNIPAGGGWTRLSVPVSTVKLGGRSITGMSFLVNGGKVWFDRAGIEKCTSAPPQAASLNPNDFVWVDDAVPPGATLTGTWTWDTTQKAAGTQSMLNYAGASVREFWFTGAAAIQAGVNDNLLIHALIDPCDPPRAIAVYWYDGSWAHRAYWGENIINSSSSGGVSMGAIPAGGEWVQLEMPARGLNLANRPVTGLSMAVHTGRVWFDRAGKRTCTVPLATPPALSATEIVWFDDATPAGAVRTGTWTWDTQQRASGTSSNMVPPGGEKIEHSFTGAAPLAVGANDTLTVYTMIDPCDPPREVMISWYDGTSWEHRAYWGEGLFQYGTAGPSRFAMGALPAPGQWVRLQVPASAVGLAGVNVTGIKFSTFAGKAWFDRVGLEPGSSAATTPEAAPEMIEVRSFSDRLRDLATLLAYGRGRTSFRYQSLQSTSPWSAPTASTPAVHSGPPARRYSLYTPELNLLAETELTAAQAPTIAYDYIWFGGQPLAQITTATNEIAWYFNDHLGAPLIQTDAAANIVWRVELDPYGTTYTTRAGADRHQPLSLPGQEVTVENETAYNIFRWYRSGWARYTQADPTGLAAGLNLYAYALGIPNSLIDPLGAEPKFPQFPGTKTDGCKAEEWKYCEGKCGSKPVVGCYVTITHKLKTVKGFPQFGLQRTVNCNCKEDDCEKSWPGKLNDWWKEFTDPDKPFLPPFIPIPPKLPTPKPVLPGLPPFFINPCMLNPSLCYGDTGIA